MKIFQQIRPLRAALEAMRRQSLTIGFVPTMGALHEGHLALIRQAKEACDCLVVSIFVNPTQFGAGEDFQAYPRVVEADIALLEKENVDYCFTPTVQEMWPTGCETVVETVNLSQILMGTLRPGHFRGVTSVVAKLFNIVQPQIAYFGEKDFQQLAIIRRMVEDLAFPVAIVGVTTVRDEDGVALSSRNALLSPQDRIAARIIPQALKATESLYKGGERRANLIVKAARDILIQEPRAKIDSIDLRDYTTLAAVEDTLSRPAVLLLSVQFGSVRLIDQLSLNNIGTVFGSSFEKM